MADIVVRISGDEAVMAKLRKLGQGVLNLKSPMSDIGTYLTGFLSGQVFASRGGIIGEPWAPLNQRYAARKAEEFPGRPPLIREGLMQRSFKKNAGRASATIFNTAPHFGYHQGGTSRIPARVMMKVDHARQIRIAEIISVHLARLAS